MDIEQKLKQVYNLAKTLNGEERVLGVFAYGSQNYNLDIKDSDLDVLVIIIPSLNSFIYNEKPINKVWKYDKNGSTAVFKDIRLFFPLLEKASINSLEIIFSKYFIINSSYEEEWNRIIEDRENIAKINPQGTVNSILSLSRIRYKKLEKEPSLENQLENFNKLGYRPKELMYLAYYKGFLDQLLENKTFEEAFRPPFIDLIKSLRFGDLTLLEVRPYADELIESIEKNVNSLFIEKFENASILINDVWRKILKKSIEKEIKEEEKFTSLN